MGVSYTIRRHRRVELLACLVLATLLCGRGAENVAEGQETNSPELKLSLREAIQAAVDNNVNVRLLKERIASAQAQANTSLGSLLPHVGGYLNGRNQTVNLAAFGLPADRLSALGHQRGRAARPQAGCRDAQAHRSRGLPAETDDPEGRHVRQPVGRNLRPDHCRLTVAVPSDMPESSE